MVCKRNFKWFSIEKRQYPSLIGLSDQVWIRYPCICDLHISSFRNNKEIIRIKGFFSRRRNDAIFHIFDKIMVLRRYSCECLNERQLKNTWTPFKSHTVCRTLYQTEYHFWRQEFIILVFLHLRMFMPYFPQYGFGWY